MFKLTKFLFKKAWIEKSRTKGLVIWTNNFLAFDFHVKYSMHPKKVGGIIQTIYKMNEEDSRGKKHVKWDEEKLKETEKYRGTYQKI